MSGVNFVPPKAPPVRLKITRLSKGIYRWEIDVAGDNPHDVLKTVRMLDEELRKLYLGKHEPEAVKSEQPGRLKEITNALGSLTQHVVIEDSIDSYIVSPKQFLGSNIFARISRAIEELGGKYLSDGKNSRWIIPKQP